LDSALQSITLKTANVQAAASGASGAATITNLSSGVAVGLSGNITDGSDTAAVKAVYGATATAAVLELTNAYSSETGNDVLVAFNGAKLDTLTISGTTNKTSTITGKVVVGVASGDAAPFTALNVNGGSTQVNIDASALTGLKTINLSGSTGATTIASAAAGATVAITGSAQADTVTHSANLTSTTKLNINLGVGNDKLLLTSGTIDFLSADVVLNGGDGIDTLGLAYADIADLVSASKKATVSGFETLAITGAATTAQSVDASKLSAFSTLVWSGTNSGYSASATSGTSTDAITVTKVQSAQTYSFTSNVTGGAGNDAGSASAATANGRKALVFSLESDGSTDVINLSVGDATATAATTQVTIAAGAAGSGGAVAASSVDATEFETINLASVGVNDAASLTAGTIGTNANVIGGGSNTNSIVIGANGTIKVTGTKDLLFTGAISGQNATLDASGMTAAGVEVTMDGTNNTVKGGAGNNKIDGGAGNDTITTYGGADEITGGAGRDTIDAGAGNDLIYANDTGSNTDRADDTITLGTGSDVVFVSTLFSVTTTDNYAYSIDKITDFVGGTDKIKIGAGTAAANAFYDVKSVDTSAAANLIAAATSAMAGAVTKFGAANAANDVFLFTYGGKDYIFMDEATAGAVNTGDAIIEVTGISGTAVKTDFLFNA